MISCICVIQKQNKQTKKPHKKQTHKCKEQIGGCKSRNRGWGMGEMSEGVIK